eukprot:TRINITY_DN9523_c0_g1_i1.p1 TRINITY_DN9523_c0_g1~~TRINITY_DN9523_c0_g1_i1.p1  ORF type:complete len:118 (+),score=7.10 TRINITY_DN9523_c0_g1_i1:170-523(+)
MRIRKWQVQFSWLAVPICIIQNMKLLRGGINDMGELHDFEVPCAVCETSATVETIMLPGTFECIMGWILQYRGYLMSAHHGHHGKTEYICVSDEAEGRGTSANENGALIYPVEPEGI